jgi:drug/metabolite transporter (DMT)-like permease
MTPLRSSDATASPARPFLIAVALGIVYVVWGSTYLAIRVAVRDLPPLALASWRYAAAALLLAGILAVRGGPRRLRATPRELLACAALGLLLPALGNGMVTLGEEMGSPSGIAALLVAAVPLWVVVYRSSSGDRVPGRTIIGVLIGFAGLVGLVTASGLGGHVRIAACLVIVFATACWSLGTWSSPLLRLPKDPFVTTVYEMAFGAAFLFAGAALRGENVVPGAGSLESWLAWLYLVTFGSVVAFSAYVWVLKAAPVSLVATYAYVNPVVAVFLGWLILGETITPEIVVGGGVVVASVALVISSERQTRARARPLQSQPPETQPRETQTSDASQASCSPE